MADNASGSNEGQVDACTGQPESSEMGLHGTIDKRISRVVSVNDSSEECFDYNCDPCKRAGEYTQADGYCTNCKEYLCSTCFRSHSRSKVSTHHVLLDKVDMPKPNAKVCNPCKLSGVKIEAVGYCKDCCDFLCKDCYKHHPRNKLSRHHVLVKNEDIVQNVEHASSSSVAKLISKGSSTKGKTKEVYDYVRDMYVKSYAGEKDCNITDMTIVSNDTIVLCDRNNRCLKLFDTEKNKMRDVLALQYQPFGVTTISNDQIAVVLEQSALFSHSYKIQIVKTRGQLTLDRTIKTKDKCLDVKMMSSHLYVSFHQPLRFKIFNQTGLKMRTIKPDEVVLKHCSFPRHIAVCPDERVIYVSDCKTNKVLSLDMNGYMVALYQNALKEPCGIIISPCRSVFVCIREQHIVYKMKSDLSEAAVILGPGDGIVAPHAICLNTENQHFYISCGSSYAKYKDNIKVYKC